MSWGTDPSKWGKPITTRFDADDLARLDWLVANYGRESHAKAPTRSSTILKALRDVYSVRGGPAIAAKVDDRQLDAFVEKPSVATSSQTGFRCQACGHEEPKWLGKCPKCGAWGTLTEPVAAAAKTAPRTSERVRRRSSTVPARKTRAKAVPRPRQTARVARPTKTRRPKKAARRGGSR